MPAREVIQLKKNLGQQIRIFEKLKDQLAERPTVQRSHKLRVTTRRLHAILGILENARGIDPTKKASKKLNKICRLLGRQREVDVLIRDCKKFHFKDPVLYRKQRKIYSKVKRAAQKENLVRLLQALKRIKKQFHRHSAIDWNRSRKRLNSKFRLWQVEMPESDRQFHRLRIEIKDQRYRLEALGHSSSKLKKIQDLLGRLHDLSILGEKEGTCLSLEKELRKLRGEARLMIRPTIQFLKREMVEI